MKRILNNFKLLLVVVTVLVVFNIFVTGSAVSKYLLATKFAIWNVQRNNKFTFGTSFAQLYGDEFNPFKEVSFLDDEAAVTEKQAEQQASGQSQGKTGGTTVSYEELKKNVRRALDSTGLSNKDVLADMYAMMASEWVEYKTTYPKTPAALSGIIGNAIGEGGGSSVLMEGSWSKNQKACLGFTSVTTWGDLLKFFRWAQAHNSEGRTSPNYIGGIGLFGFTYHTLFKPLIEGTEKYLKDNGLSESDKVDDNAARNLQMSIALKKLVAYKSINDLPQTYWSEMAYEFPSSYGSKVGEKKSSVPLYYETTDWFAYGFERNQYTGKGYGVDETTTGIRNNAWRREQAKIFYEAVKDIPLDISSSASSSNQTNVTPTVGQGNSIWIMGDSRTHQLIAYLDSKLKSSKEGATKSLAQWSKTGTSPTYAKYKITENGKTIELNVFGVGSMGFKSSLGGNSSSGETAQYKDYLAQVGYINNANNVIFLWFGVNGDTPSNYRSMCKDIYGNVPMFQFSVPAGLSQWGTPSVIPFDSKNNILLKEFKDNYIDVCGGDQAFTYNGSDVGTFKDLGEGKYYGGSDFLHFKIPGGYDILWPNIKKGIFDRIK